MQLDILSYPIPFDQKLFDKHFHRVNSWESYCQMPAVDDPVIRSNDRFAWQRAEVSINHHAKQVGNLIVCSAWITEDSHSNHNGCPHEYLGYIDLSAKKWKLQVLHVIEGLYASTVVTEVGNPTSSVTFEWTKCDGDYIFEFDIATRTGSININKR